MSAKAVRLLLRHRANTAVTLKFPHGSLQKVAKCVQVEMPSGRMRWSRWLVELCLPHHNQDSSSMACPAQYHSMDAAMSSRARAERPMASQIPRKVTVVAAAFPNRPGLAYLGTINAKVWAGGEQIIMVSLGV